MKRKFKAPRRKSETKLSKVSESKPLKRRKVKMPSTKTMEIKNISTDPEKSEEEQIETENDYDNTNGTDSKLKLTQDAEVLYLQIIEFVISVLSTCSRHIL